MTHAIWASDGTNELSASQRPPARRRQFQSQPRCQGATQVLRDHSLRTRLRYETTAPPPVCCAASELQTVTYKLDIPAFCHAIRREYDNRHDSSGTARSRCRARTASAFAWVAARRLVGYLMEPG